MTLLNKSPSQGGAPSSNLAPQEAASLVEVGWVIVAPANPVTVEAARLARDGMLERLQSLFPEYHWQMPLLQIAGGETGPRVEPVGLLDLMEAKRDARGWDFALAVTSLDLESHYKPFSLAAPSRVFSAGVLSTARLDPLHLLASATQEERVRMVAQRLLALALRIFGHLNDLGESGDPQSFMREVQAVTDLNAMSRFSAGEQEEMRATLAGVADMRLEETGQFRDRAVAFYARAAFINRADVLQAVRRANPWLFPIWLSRLTTAAISALLILVVTAEAWELGMDQPAWRVALLSGAALLFTSAYILKRQRLLVRRHGRALTEQRVVANVAMVLTVVTGMAVTYASLFGLTWLIGAAFLDDDLVTRWAGLETDVGTLGGRLIMAGFVAALGIIIGALGAAFEARSHFRHVVHVDEEI